MPTRIRELRRPEVCPRAELRTARSADRGRAPWTRGRAALALVAITLFALVVRLTGVGFQLPHEWEPDQRVYTTQVALLRGGDPAPERDVNFGWYPLLPAHVVASLPRADPGPPPATLDEHLRAASAPRREIRSVLAALSVLVVPATYCIARRFGRRETALLAAALAATSVFHVWYAQQTRPHGLATATIALGLAGALLVRRRGDALAYLAGGASLALAVSVLQSGLAILPALVCAHVLCARPTSRQRNACFAAALALVLLAVRLAYPFVFRTSAGTGQDAAQFGLEDGRFNLSGHSVDFGLFGVGGFRVLAEAWLDYDPAILLLAVLGAVVIAGRAWQESSDSRAVGSWRALARENADLLVVLSFALPYAFVFGFYERTYPRFALPLLPLLAVAAAVLALESPAPRWLRRAALALCVVQAVFVVRLVAIRTGPGTAELAADWLAAHADRERDRVLLQSGLDLPLFRDADSRADARLYGGSDARPWLKYQVDAARAGPLEPAWSLRNFAVLPAASRRLLAEDPRGWVHALDADWIVTAPGLVGRSRELAAACDAIARHCELAARFAPLAFVEGDPAPFVFQNDIQPRTASVWLRLPIAVRPGAALEVWRTPRELTQGVPVTR